MTSEQPLSILVVDDDMDNASSLGELFEMEGHAVSVVHSGQAAIDAYVSDSFDLAFMDVIMPGKNGVESFLEIRRMRPEAKVYMMTGYSVEELLQQAISEGALGVLSKPFDPSEVLSLSASVGPGGIVVATPTPQRGLVGDAIYKTITGNGQACQLITSVNDLSRSVGSDEVLIIDAALPVIDGVSVYRNANSNGHRAPTFIVPPTPSFQEEHATLLRDISSTGVLNKPFNPMLLLQRLRSLAA
jgi:two-component system, NtrC family, response regulator HydG